MNKIHFRPLIKFSVIFSLVCLLNINVSAQQPITVSSTGIGEIKLNMTLEQVEKIISQPLKLEQADEQGYSMDTIKIKYKGVDLLIEFYSTGSSEEQAKKIQVYGISASHLRCKPKVALALEAISLTL